MILFDKLQDFIASLDEKQFYKYLATTIGVIALIVFFVFIQHSRKVRYLKKRINNINELREEAKVVLDKMQQVKQQRIDVDTMLAQDPDFKIAGYFNGLLAQLHLLGKKVEESVRREDRDENYQETILNIKFDDMNMRALTELLSALEQQERVYTKELEITKSKKKPKTIEVAIAIATLQPKEQPLE